MKRTLITVGNSTAVTIPSDILDRYDLKAGDAVEINQAESGIVITPHQKNIDPDVERAMRAVLTERREVFKQLAAHDKKK